MIEYELFHLDADNRTSKNYLNRLHQNFIEIGQSGQLFTKADLAEKDLDGNDYVILDFHEHQLSDKSFLCMYTLWNKTGHTQSRRCSIWVYEDERWQLLFHQGTSVNEENFKNTTNHL